MMLQDAQTEELLGHFSQYGPVAACQLAHNNSALITLVERQSNLQVIWLACLYPCIALKAHTHTSSALFCLTSVSD